MDLKLLAFDTDDLAVISAHLQDATVLESDMGWASRERRFALLCQRRDHVGTDAPRPCGLHFNFVTKVERLRLAPTEPGAPRRLTLIGLDFETTQAPSGKITLLFEGAAAIRLTVECIDGAMHDLPSRHKD